MTKEFKSFLNEAVEPNMGLAALSDHALNRALGEVKQRDYISARRHFHVALDTGYDHVDNLEHQIGKVQTHESVLSLYNAHKHLQNIHDEILKIKDKHDEHSKNNEGPRGFSISIGSKYLSLVHKDTAKHYDSILKKAGL